MVSKINKYRNAIMGTAILWIMLYHSEFSFTGIFPIFSSAASFLRLNGFGGVDIFLFVSGFGLFQSLSRNSEPINFYKRRIKRILPTYLPVLIVWLLITLMPTSIKELLITLWNNLTGLAFWLQRTPQFNWYILALPVFYLLAPVFFQIMQRWEKKGELALLGLTILVDICFLNNYIMIAISRFTIFALGMITGRYYWEKKEVGKGIEVFIYILGILGWGLLYVFRISAPQLLWNYGLYWYPFIFITPACVFFLCRLFDLLSKIAIGRLVSFIFEIMGTCSLEIYLLHINLFASLPFTSNWFRFVAMCVVVILSYLFHNIVAIVLRQNRKKSSISHGANKEN